MVYRSGFIRHRSRNFQVVLNMDRDQAVHAFTIVWRSRRLWLSMLVSLLLFNTTVLGAPRRTTTTPEPENLPSFGITGKRIRVVTNDTVVLPCDVVNIGVYAVVWKKGIAVLTAGPIVITPDRRIKILDGTNLQITNIQTDDAGNYVCQIGTMQPKEISHTVEILVPSRIKYVTSGGNIDTKKDAMIKLDCDADGNPPPNITWTRRNNVLPSGDKNLTGDTLIIQSATRHDAGVYICTAYNNVGQPAEQTITVNILYPPEISLERDWVHTGEGNEALLVCIVNAEPQAEVSWYRDTLKLDTNERRITEVRGSRHTLIVRKVQASDFGNYSCMADNIVGKTKATLELSGKPHPVIITSNATGRHMNDYNLSWTVDSYTPIEEFKLFYKKVLLPNEVDTRNQYQWPKKPRNDYNDAMLGTPIYGYNSMRNEWNDVVLPALPSEQFTHRMSYIIRGLEAGSEYEAKVMAKNRFGWTPLTPAFKFTTALTPEIGQFSVINAWNSLYRELRNVFSLCFGLAQTGNDGSGSSSIASTSSFIGFSQRSYNIAIAVIVSIYFTLV
ncbi:neurotrimin-like isoform X2 [Adelges cooleyi]|uniref:neurotrimin-like isoform X2 n=1 Tax=Adelges cooleyi TaxID=133065 RepID=UPI00217F8FDC|nr:neurotrimin-like isoform X2 [Adelges cooleyi]